MIDLFPDHCEVVKDSLSGARAVDEHTHASLAVLDDRLQRVKKLGQKFSIVEFSPAVRRLRSRSNKLAVL
jgi:anti-anti-sigma regulatory factor